jgi:hypothetical protein
MKRTPTSPFSIRKGVSVLLLSVLLGALVSGSVTVASMFLSRRTTARQQAPLFDKSRGTYWRPVEAGHQVSFVAVMIGQGQEIGFTNGAVRPETHDHDLPGWGRPLSDESDSTGDLTTWFGDSFGWPISYASVVRTPWQTGLNHRMFPGVYVGKYSAAGWPNKQAIWLSVFHLRGALLDSMVFGLPLFLRYVLFQSILRTNRRIRNMCLVCGYPQDSSGICPECGMRSNPNPDPS